MVKYFVFLSLASFFISKLFNCSNRGKQLNCNSVQFSFMDTLSYKELLIDRKNYFIIASYENTKNPHLSEVKLFSVNKSTELQSRNLLDSISGTYICSTQNEFFLYVVAQEYRKGYNPIYSSNVLHVISKTTGRQKEILSLGGSSFIKSLHFDNSSNGFVFFKDNDNSNLFSLFYTKDGGSTWGIKRLNYQVSKTYEDTNMIYFSDIVDNKLGNEIYSINKNTLGLDSILIGEEIVDFQICNSKFYILVKEKEQFNIIIYKAVPSEKPIFKSVINSFPKEINNDPVKLYVHNDFISLAFQIIDKNLLFGFGGVKYKIKFSKDDGKSWNWSRELIEQCNYYPIFFEDSLIMNYDGEGKFNKCSLK